MTQKWPQVMGIDIGSQNLKYILLHRKGPRMRVESFGRYSLIRGGEENIEEIYRVINQLFKNGKGKRLSKISTIVGIKGSKIVVRRESYPGLSRKELEQTIAFGIQEEMDGAGEESEVVTDFRIVGPDPKNEENQEYLVMGIPQVLADETIQPFITENVNLKKVIPQVVALANLLHFLPGDVGKETIGILDIGANRSVLIFIRQNQLDFYREIVVGGEDFTKSIIGTIFHEGKAIQFTSTEAKEFKMKYGYPIGFSESMTFRGAPLSEIGAMMRPVIERLAGEIHRSIGFYREKAGGEEVKGLYLVGGGSRLRHLADVLKQKLELPVQAFKIPKGLDVAGGTKKQKLFKDKFLEQTMSLALAMETSTKGNLLPPSYQKIQQMKFFQSIFNLVSFGLLGLIALIIFITYSDKIRIQNNLLHLKERVRMAENIGQQFTAYTMEKKEIEDEINQIRSKINTDPEIIQVLRMLSHIVPRDMYLELINYKQSAQSTDDSRKSKSEGEPEKATSNWSVTIWAKSKTPPEDVKISVAKILVEMEKSGYFTDVKLIKEKLLPDASLYQCEITGYLK